MDQMQIIDILAAYILDLAVGDPAWFPHPVRFIGFLINKTEKWLRPTINFGSGKTEQKELTAGAVLTFFIVAVTFSFVYLFLAAAKQVNPVFYHVCNIYFIYTALASRCLANESIKVYRALKRNDITKARNLVGMLVSRDTQNLDQKQVIRAIVETTAENTVDGVIAPFFYIFLGSVFGLSAPLVYAFKAASTLDSMVGYKNERYLYFGRVSAKLDDAMNYLPARLSGVVIPLAAFCCGKRGNRSFQIMFRDRRNHQSPNCAYPEAAVAGALGIQLGGTNSYFGHPVEKPTIGDANKELELRDIPDTIKLMLVSSFLILTVGLTIGLVIIGANQ
ncbi:MAG TPA: adenosylcobinamide-phosphate synthase CbiB [Bacillota bacterium]|nr:adenosylcobinamide-phosphate synthase CbiB [Bacillota bacterium]